MNPYQSTQPSPTIEDPQETAVRKVLFHCRVLGVLLLFPVIVSVSTIGFLLTSATSMGFTEIGIFGILMAFPAAAAIGLFTLRPWARLFALVVFSFGMLNIPIGTLIGLYAWNILRKPEAMLLFQRSKGSGANGA